MKFSRDVLLAVALLVLLGVVSVYGALQNRLAAPPYSSLSTAPDGTSALRSWLDVLDFSAFHDRARSFRPPDGADVILILQPLQPITGVEWQLLDQWLEAGGILVIAGDNRQSIDAIEHFDTRLNFFTSDTTATTLQTPLLVDPIIASPEALTLRSDLYFDELPSDAVVLLSKGERPLIITVPRGNGRVILATTIFPFSNAGLKEPENPALVLNLVALAEAGARIWFDEWHHGLRDEEGLGPGDWLRETPIGQSLLLTATIIFLALVVNGRRFGRPVPLPESRIRRTPLEYVSALANLSRRAGHHTAALAHYRLQLKRGLGRRYRLNPTLPDGEFIARLAEFNPELDRATLSALLHSLEKRQVSDAELVRLGAAVAEWLDEP